MTSVNLFDKIRYLLTFFGNWTLDLVPTLNNMIMKVIDCCSAKNIECTDINKELSFHFYAVGINYHYPMNVNDDPHDNWIMLTPQSYKITSANFYISLFNLIPGRFVLLVSQFKGQPLQLTFVKVVNTPCGETFHNPALGIPSSSGSVTKMEQVKLIVYLLYFIIIETQKLFLFNLLSKTLN
jgi:hypothetical protein